MKHVEFAVVATHAALLSMIWSHREQCPGHTDQPSPAALSHQP